MAVGPLSLHKSCLKENLSENDIIFGQTDYSYSLPTIPVPASIHVATQAFYLSRLKDSPGY